MQLDSTPAQHRAILCHFDSYSAALLFARWENGSLLWPGPLPAGSAPANDSVAPSTPTDGQSMRQAVVQHLGLNDAELIHMTDFNERLASDGTPVHVHLLCFKTFEAPAQAIAPSGGQFRHLPALRGSDPAELALLREVFNLMIGGSRH